MKTYDVIIVGAGASGLMAAREVSKEGKTVCILEARDRIGGRLHTIHDENFSYPVETGGEFIHGKLDETFALIKEAKLDYYKLDGNVYEVKKNKWEKENDFIERVEELQKALEHLDKDVPLADFIKEHFPGQKNKSFRRSVLRYAEGYDAADPDKFSTLAFKIELDNQDENNYRLTDGYGALMQYLWKQCESANVSLRLGHAVREIRWDKPSLQLITDDGVFHARQVVLTIPLGVWQSRRNSKGSIAFIPELEDKRAAAKQLGFGGVIKFVVEFDEVLWQDKANKIGFMLSDNTIPTWWPQKPDDKPMLSGWVAGPDAIKMRQLTNNELFKKAIASLAEILGIKPAKVKGHIKAWHVFNWINDPYAKGAYAYEVVEGTKFRKILADPVDNKLFFAGEALYQGPEMGTVEAALASGKQVALELLARQSLIC